MATITLKVNGQERAVPADLAYPLQFALRDDLGLTGTKFGCGMAQCGCCTVLLDGQPVRSCVTPVTSAVGKEITTIEGLGALGRHPAPAPAGLDRRPGAPVRLLPVGSDHGGRRPAAGEPRAQRGPDPPGAGRPHLPLRDLQPHRAGRAARRRPHERPDGLAMPTVSRRTFLRTTALAGGGLVLWFTQPAATPMPALAQSAPARGGGGFGGAIPKDVDSWLKVSPDGTVSLYSGKVEFGQGIQTAFAQLVADELDVSLAAVRVIMGSTDQVPYDNPTVGSQSMRATGPLVRQAAAEMRAVAARPGRPAAGRLARRALDQQRHGQRDRPTRHVGNLRPACRGPAERPPDVRPGAAQDARAVRQHRPGGAARRRPIQSQRQHEVRLRHDRAGHAARQDPPPAVARRHAPERRLQPGADHARV